MRLIDASRYFYKNILGNICLLYFVVFAEHALRFFLLNPDTFECNIYVNEDQHSTSSLSKVKKKSVNKYVPDIYSMYSYMY